jgi:hypothetical protein
MTEVCVVHIVRASNGVDRLRTFIESYVEHPAGAEHDLLLIFKGFQHGTEPGEFAKLLADIRHKSVFVEDRGVDIGPYLLAAEMFDHAFFAWLNSFSIIQETGWLAKMLASGSRGDIGAAGATGSWESHYSNRKVIGRLQSVPNNRSLGSGTARYVLARLAQPLVLRQLERQFDAFPNIHIRTNAVLIRRSVLLHIRAPVIRSKSDALRFESGRHGFTRQIQRMGLGVVVVGRNGESYSAEDWPASATYRAADQANLLVSDNQTQAFDQADPQLRRTLSMIAWGRDLS